MAIRQNVATPSVTPTSIAVPPAYDFSRDALTPQAQRSASPQDASRISQQAMEERVINQSRATPGQLVQGAQTGRLPDGTPQTFQAFTYGQPSGGTSRVSSNPPSVSYPPTGQGGQGVSGNINTPPGMTGTNNFSVNGAPIYQAPGLDDLNSRISGMQVGRTDAEIEQDLQAEMRGIQADFDARVARARINSQNRRGERFSDLAGLMVNPLSSSAENVSAGVESELADVIRNEEAQKFARQAAARAAARGEKTTAQQSMLTRLIAERDRLEKNASEQYSRSFNLWKEQQNNALQLAQEMRQGREFDATERERNRDWINNQFTLFGSRAFDQLTPENQRAIEQASGLPAGSLNRNVRTLKEQEQAAGAASPFQVISGTQHQQPLLFNRSTGTYQVLPDAARLTPDYQFIPGTDNQIPLVFDQRTGTYQQLPGSLRPETSSSLPPALRADINQGRNDLMRGLSWNSVLGRMRTLYPTIPQATLEQSLGTEFQNPEYWRTLQRAQQEFRGTPDPFAIGGTNVTNPAIIPGSSPVAPPPQDDDMFSTGGGLTEEEMNVMRGLMQ